MTDNAPENSGVYSRAHVLSAPESASYHPGFLTLLEKFLTVADVFLTDLKIVLTVDTPLFTVLKRFTNA